MFIGSVYQERLILERGASLSKQFESKHEYTFVGKQNLPADFPFMFGLKITNWPLEFVYLYFFCNNLQYLKLLSKAVSMWNVISTDWQQN